MEKTFSFFWHRKKNINLMQFCHKNKLMSLGGHTTIQVFNKMVQSKCLDYGCVCFGFYLKKNYFFFLKIHFIILIVFVIDLLKNYF
jgi:hypothetical protein